MSEIADVTSDSYSQIETARNRQLEIIVARGELRPKDYAIDRDIAGYEPFMPPLNFIQRVEGEVPTRTFPDLFRLLHPEPGSHRETFLQAWNTEESAHQIVLLKFLRAYNATIGFDVIDRRPLDIATPAVSSPSRAQRFAEFATNTEFMLNPISYTADVIGFEHELIGSAAYRRIADRAKLAGLPHLHHAIRRIGGQESAHGRYYKYSAELTRRRMHEAELRIGGAALRIGRLEQVIAQRALSSFFSPNGVNSPEQARDFGQLAEFCGQTTESVMQLINDGGVVRFLGAKTLRRVQEEYMAAIPPIPDRPQLRDPALQIA